jgi:hypothetical protein
VTHLDQARQRVRRQPEPSGNGHQGRTSIPPGGPHVEIFTAADLEKMELPAPRWAVEGIIPEGLSLLAGKPKLGKSWFALNLALAVALGGIALGSIRVERGDVLYLALEDTKRRLKDRIAKLTARQEIRGGWPANLQLARSWPRQDKGGLAEIFEWLHGHLDARLVVVDTWPKFRPMRAGRGDCYEEDYAHAAELKAVGDEHGVAILANAHCRKLAALDPLEEVSGTLGLTGAADGIAVLRRERGQLDASLSLTGRDIEEREIALRFDPQCALWSILGDAEEYRLGKERQEIIDVLKTGGEPLTPKEVAGRLDKSPGAVKTMMFRMGQAGQLQSIEGKYTISNRGNPSNPTAIPAEKPAICAGGTVPTVTAEFNSCNRLKDASYEETRPIDDTVTAVTTVTAREQEPGNRLADSAPRVDEDGPYRGDRF